MTFDRFEPIGWAIFRGVIAAYSCIGLVTFATYAIYTQVQLSSNQAYTLQESIIPFKQCADVVGSTTTYVTAFQIVSMPHLPRILNLIRTIKSSDDRFDSNFHRDRFPSLSSSEDYFYIARDGGWWYNTSNNGQAPSFNLQWTGNDSVMMWATMPNWDHSIEFGIVGDRGTFGIIDETQVQWTKPLILAPNKNYAIPLIKIQYMLGSYSFFSYIPGA